MSESNANPTCDIWEMFSSMVVIRCTYTASEVPKIFPNTELF